MYQILVTIVLVIKFSKMHPSGFQKEAVKLQ